MAARKSESNGGMAIYRKRVKNVPGDIIVENSMQLFVENEEENWQPA